MKRRSSRRSTDLGYEITIKTRPFDEHIGKALATRRRKWLYFLVDLLYVEWHRERAQVRIEAVLNGQLASSALLILGRLVESVVRADEGDLGRSSPELQ